MSILLGFLGATVFSGVAAIFIFFFAIAYLPDIIIGILIFLIYALTVVIGIIGLCITCSAYSKGGKFGGVLVMVLGFGGLIALINIGDIEDFAREQKAKQQIAILDNAKTFISIENLCDSEDIEMVEILFTPKMVDSPAVQNYRGYNTNVYVDNVNSQRTQNAKWEHAWPSPSSEVPFEITKIPVAKNDTNFAVRLTTKDKKQTVIDEKTYKPYFRHKVYFEPKDINPNNESLIKIVYDGSKLLIKNDNIIRNDEPFFTENTIIFYDFDSFQIKIDGKNASDFNARWEQLKKQNSFYKNKNYHPFFYNRLDVNGMPLNITMMNIEQGKTFSILYTKCEKIQIFKEYKDITRNVYEDVSKTFTANKRNLIYVNAEGVVVSNNPNFCKFDFTI